MAIHLRGHITEDGKLELDLPSGIHYGGGSDHHRVSFRSPLVSRESWSDSDGREKSRLANSRPRTGPGSFARYLQEGRSRKGPAPGFTTRGGIQATLPCLRRLF